MSPLTLPSGHSPLPKNHVGAPLAGVLAAHPRVFWKPEAERLAVDQKVSHPRARARTPNPHPTSKINPPVRQFPPPNPKSPPANNRQPLALNNARSTVHKLLS